MGFWDFFDTQRKPSSNYPSTFADLPADMDDWSCDHWKIYYERNKAAAGKQYALDIVNIDSGRVHSFADLGYCKYNCEWLNYMRSEGFTIDTVVGDIFCNTAGVVTSVTGSAKTITKIIPLVVIAGLGFIAYDQYEKRK